MADATTKRYIYPPDWQENVSGDGQLYGRAGHQGGGFKKYILHLTNISAGTGESDATKLDLSVLMGPTGRPARRTVIDWVDYDVYGMDVTLYWERDPQALVICRIPGGSSTQSGTIRGPLYDPGTGDGTDGTGNILLTTSNATSGDSYDLRICIRPKEGIKPNRNMGT